MKILFSLLLMITSNAAFGSYRLNWVHYRGTFLLINGDSLKGDILLYQLMNGTVFVRHNFLGYGNRYEDILTSEENAKWIKFTDIIPVTIAADSVEQNVVVYENLSQRNSLWRLLLKNENCGIYDDTMIPDWQLAEAPRKMILATKNKIVEMYSTQVGLYVTLRQSLF